MQALGRIVKKKEYTDVEKGKHVFATGDKSNSERPCNNNCARNSDHMVQLFIHEVLKNDFMPKGEIADYLKRV